MKLFIDDERKQPEGWAHARTNKAVELVLDEYYRSLSDISFDHDDGTRDGFKPAVELVVSLFESGKLKKDKTNITVHSANPVGALWIINRFKDIDVVCNRVRYEFQGQNTITTTDS